MALVSSTMVELGHKAPDFSLSNGIDEKRYLLGDCIQEKGILVVFTCNHCPYVLHIRDSLVSLCHQILKQGLGVVWISANDPKKYPQDAPLKMHEQTQELELEFPYLFDSDQSVARDYQAMCTPDFFLYDQNKTCVYRGQFDDSRPSNSFAVTGEDLQRAVNALVKNEAPIKNQKPSSGCSIKWRAN